VVVPVIEPDAGEVTIVTTVVVYAVPQLLVNEYDIVAEPAATPVTTPPAVTVAFAVFELLQAPPETASANVVVPPEHAEAVPVIVPAFGEGFTVIERVAAVVLQPLVTE
jgi:hypothetical protein